MSGTYKFGTPINLVERFYTINPLTEAATPANPTIVTFVVEAPDGTETSHAWPGDPAVSNPAVGVFVCALAPPAQVGTYRTACIGAGAVVAESPGSFEVLPSGVDPAAVQPVATLGPCQTWIDGDDVAACCDAGVGSSTFLLDDFAAVASMLAYELSGRLFPGVCTRTVRPCRAACGCFGRSSGAGLPWFWSSGYDWRNECGDRCGCGSESYVRLAGYPVREVLQVKLDGATLSPTGEYRLDGRRNLIRLADPGPPALDRAWPGCQDLALDDSQPGTFSVTYSWGSDPPELGRLAAASLACELWKACPGNGGECKLPSKVTKVVRQGITVERVVPIAEMLRSGSSGLPLLDAFIAAYNPKGTRRRPALYSPDQQPFARRVG